MPTAKSSMQRVILTLGIRAAIVLRLSALTAEPQFVPMTACGAAVNHFVNGAATITFGHNVEGNQFRMSNTSLMFAHLTRQANFLPQVFRPIAGRRDLSAVRKQITVLACRVEEGSTHDADGV